MEPVLGFLKHGHGFRQVVFDDILLHIFWKVYFISPGMCLD